MHCIAPKTKKRFQIFHVRLGMLRRGGNPEEEYYIANTQNGNAEHI